MDKISYDTYVSMSADRNRRKEFRAYSTVIPGENGFDFRVVPNPDLVVDVPDDIDRILRVHHPLCFLFRWSRDLWGVSEGPRITPGRGSDAHRRT